MRFLRTINMNPNEPQQIGIQAPQYIPVTLDIQYLDFVGQPVTSDLGGQLQVTSRTDNHTLVYAAPATDIVNGKARVSFGSEDLLDINGYNVRLIGTYRGELGLFATGIFRVTGGIGTNQVPVDVIDNIPLTFSYNYDASVNVRLWVDSGKSAPFDTSTATIIANVLPDASSQTVLAAFDVETTTLPGEVILSLPADTVNTLPSGCWWMLMAANAGGLTTLAQGSITITGVRP